MKLQPSIVLAAIAMCLAFFVSSNGVAQAALVTKTFIAPVADGPFAGEYGTGSFTYNDTLPSDLYGNGSINVLEGLQVSFLFDGKSYSEVNGASSLYSYRAILTFNSFMPTMLNYNLVNGVNGVTFTNPIIYDMSFDPGILWGGTGGYDFTLPLTISTLPTPLPAAGYLLGSGLLGLWGISRKRKAV